MRKHIVKLAVAIGLLVGVVVGLVALTTPVRRFVVGAAALAGDEALLVTRYNDHADSRFFVELVGADGDTRWSDDTTPVRGAEALGFTGAADAGDAVVVLGVDKAAIEWVGALAKADGQPRWWTSLGGPAGRDGGGRIGPMLLVDDERALVVHEVREAAGQTADRLDALALADGRLLWSLGRAQLGGARIEVTHVGAHWLVGTAGGRELRELDPASGKTQRTFPIGTVLCAGADAVVGALDGRVSLVPLAAGEAATTFDFADEGVAWNDTCGFRGDDVVLNLQRSGGWAVVRLARASGRVAWDLPLGAAIIGTEPIAVTPALPRFVPFALRGSDGGVIPWGELIVVDTDLGRVVSRQRVTRAPQLVPVLAGERAWLWLDGPGIVAALDPATGQVASAIGLAALAGGDLRRDDVVGVGAGAGGARLWVTGRLNAHPGDLPYAVIDLGSGAVVGRNGAVTAEDATARVRALLAGENL